MNRPAKGSFLAPVAEPGSRRPTWRNPRESPASGGSDRRGRVRADRPQSADGRARIGPVLREERPRRRELGVQKQERPEQRLSLATYQHLARAHAISRLPDVQALSGLSEACLDCAL